MGGGKKLTTAKAFWEMFFVTFLEKIPLFTVDTKITIFLWSGSQEKLKKSLGQGKSGLSLASARACTLSTRMKISIFSFFFNISCLFENKSLTVTFLVIQIRCLTNYKRQDISNGRERSDTAIFNKGRYSIKTYELGE